MPPRACLPPVLLLVPLLAAAAAPPASRQLLAVQRRQAAELAAQAAAQAAAADAAAEGKRLAVERVAAAARLRATDDAAAIVAARVAALARRQAIAQAQLDAHARALGPLLPLIERLSLYPAETLLAAPLAPDQTVRGLLVLGGLTRKLRADAAAVQGEQAQVAALQQQLRTDRRVLASIAAAQTRQAATLDTQIVEARATRGLAQNQAEAAARQAAADAARADTLRAAVAAIEAARRPTRPRRYGAAHRGAMAPVIAPDAAVTARGDWIVPVAGHVSRSFGAVTDAGPARGVSFATPPNARVVSPCGGHIVFSGPFRSFGLLLIVDCGSDSHIVMAGLARLDGHVGQAVRAGEPIGVMPSWDPAQLAQPTPSLYVELRQSGQAIDPTARLHTSGITAPRICNEPHSRAIVGIEAPAVL